MIQGAMFSVVSAVEVGHNFRNPNPDHLHQDMMLNFFGSSQSCTWNRAKWTMTLERCYRVSKCFGSGSQDVPVKNIVFSLKGTWMMFQVHRFCVDWKQSKHVRKKQSELEKWFFCKAPTSSHKTIRGDATQKNEPQRGIANLTYKQ